MTPKQYAQLKSYKPLSKKEKEKGKSHLKIYGTNEPLPWSEIYTRIASGQSMEEIAKMYGHGRMITLWAIEEGVEPRKDYEEAVSTSIEARERIREIAKTDPTAAKTLMEIANETRPDLATEVVLASADIIDRVRDLVRGDYVQPSDMPHLAKAIQTCTDTIGITQRHASQAAINAQNVTITGFDFVEDNGPPQSQSTTDATDAEIVDE